MKKLFTLLWLFLAAFSFKAVAQTSCNSDFTYQFLTTSQVKFTPALSDSPAVQHSWNYGDGSAVDHTVSPTHNFAAPGTYTVVHTVIRINPNGVPLCTQSTTKQVVIASPCNLVVDFSFAPLPPNSQIIQFTNLSTPLAPTDSITWIFGDNTTSHDASPSHTYSNGGTYSVCLIVKKWPNTSATPCIKYICKTVVVAPQQCTLVVNFSSVASTANPLEIHFTNLSTPLATSDSSIWTFGDGSSSTATNPVHAYANAGNYTVCLTVKKNNPVGTTPCVRDICKTVTVSAPCTLVVDFSFSPSATNPLAIQFTNLSTPLSLSDSTTWSFGDGTTSFAVSPLHTYTSAGTYNVCLIVKKNSTVPGSTPCIRYICKTVVVSAQCTLVVDFSSVASTANPLEIHFTNLSTPLATSDSITWTFGDGSISHDVNPVHIYAHAGTYQVCLRVKKNTNSGSSPCIREICKSLIVTEPCTLVVNFSWSASTSNPLSVQFTNMSTPSSPTDSTIWNFGDGTTSILANPLHNYANAGTYNVCLIVKKYPYGTGTNACIRYTCKTVSVTAPCTLVVNFTWVTSTSNPLSIYFTNTSTPSSPTDSTLWNFGDGGTSLLPNPFHTYANAGTYNVCLIVKKYPYGSGTNACIRYTCKTVVVQSSCNLHADFTWRADSINAQKIWFTNTSTPLNSTDSVRWTFGDGSSSNLMNPDHTYAQPGSYTVCLRMQKRGPSGTVINCVSEICKTIYVYPTCNLQANFTWHADSVNAQKIWFTNTSAPITSTDSIRWTFGDGSSSNLMNPDHTYAQAGTYTVCLRVQKRSTPGGVYNCVSEICKTVVVLTSCNFQPSWTWHLDSANSRKVYFTNTTIVPVTSATATWFFGDGTSATTWNALHEYAQSGRYYVCLRIQLSPNCVKYKCDSITIPAPCNSNSNFTYVMASTNSQTYTFIPAVQNSGSQYIWTFGDGTGSSTMIATHHYSQAGTYTACLTLLNGPNCASTTCKVIVVTGQVNCDSVHVSYTFQRDPLFPNKVYFYAVSNYTILDQTWTITRLNGPNTTPPVILHQNNPVYVFADTGLYRVCLRAVTLGGCIKEYCNYIHIEHVAPLCTLQAYPNPASTSVSVNVTLTAATMINVYVYNTINVLVKEKHQPGVVGNNIVTLSISDLVAGFYTMKVIYGNNNCTSYFQKL